MEFRVLGPVEVLADGRALEIGRPRQRCVLAVLLAEPNRVVPTSRLIDRVWGENPPASARNVLYGHVGRLKATLTRPANGEQGVALSRRSGGYLLSVDPNAVDLHRFRHLAASARHSDDDNHAAALLHEAHTLWRGPAFADAPSSWLLDLRTTLENERLSTVLDRNESFIRLNKCTEILGELRELAMHQPLDERIARQLIIALYRSGKRADALAAYAEIRNRLADELGLDPSPALQTLEQQILVSDPTLLAPQSTWIAGTTSRVPAVPRQLPADISDFTGRGAELAELDALVEAAETAPTCTFGGPPGVGKSALAVHWAHRVHERFPDGELYADLHGAGVDPADVLARFLRALGVDTTDIPPGLDARAETFRSLVSERRLLVLIDNAADDAQVRPLLPGSATCGVLVTSHARLGSIPGAHRVELDVLSSADAITLLGRIVGTERVHAEPAAAANLVTLCEGWPLALRIAGAKLVAKPHWSIARMASRLADERHRLDELSYGALDFRASVAPIYDTLGAGARQLFRSLGLVEDLQDTAADVGASLLGTTTSIAEELLEQLIDARLLEPNGENLRDGPRYHFHELIRLFAQERARSRPYDD
jgi:DNA-binding SARP family transcriptional activator